MPRFCYFLTNGQYLTHFVFFLTICYNNSSKYLKYIGLIGVATLKAKKYVTLYYLFLIWFVSLTAAVSPLAAKEVQIAGTIIFLAGEAGSKSPGRGEFMPLGNGSIVRVGDILVSRRDSKLQLELLDGSFINLASGSQLLFKQFIFDKEKDRLKSVVKLTSGSVRVIMAEKAFRGSMFVVETENSTSFIGKSGGDFFVALGEGRSEVSVLRGHVNTRNSSPLLIGQEWIGKGKISVVEDGKSPTRPVKLKRSKKKKLIKDSDPY